MAITDLTNTTWYVPSGWSTDGLLGEDFYINIVYENKQYSNIYIGGGLEQAPDGFEIYGGPNSLVLSNGDQPFTEDEAIEIVNTSGSTLTFTGGTDVTNTSLISWLETYGELQVPTPTDAVTITYNNTVIASLKAGQSATLQCKNTEEKPNLMLTDIIVTVPEGMGAGEVVEEWDGSIEVV